MGKRRRLAALFRNQVFYKIVDVDHFDFNTFQIGLNFWNFGFSAYTQSNIHIIIIERLNIELAK